jgi:hypothetical protein
VSLAPQATIYYVVEIDPQGRRSICKSFVRRDRAETFADKRWAGIAEGYQVYVASGGNVFRIPSG